MWVHARARWVPYTSPSGSSMVFSCPSEGQLLLKEYQMPCACGSQLGYPLLFLPSAPPPSILALDLRCLLRSRDSSMWLLPESTLAKGQVSQAVYAPVWALCALSFSWTGEEAVKGPQALSGEGLPILPHIRYSLAPSGCSG